MLNVHAPVLINEIKAAFENIEIRTFLDATLGAGGHAESLLSGPLKECQAYVGFDQDSDILQIAKKNLLKYGEKILFVNSNFKNLKKELSHLSVKKIEGALFDLGVSSMQLDSESRGFSFRFESLLDMRMDIRGGLTAYDVVNGYSEEQLFNVFKNYSDLKNKRFYVRKIIEKRLIKPIATTKELSSLFKSAVFFQRNRKKKINPATEVFQAIRIEVNDELNAIKKGLKDVFQVLRPEGLLAVISFHSLEDRIVKQFFKEKAVSCRCDMDQPFCNCEGRPLGKLIVKKPIMANDEEVNDNPRSRSAKLRIIKKL